MQTGVMEGIKFVFDIDDTICNNKNRDYENAIPFNGVIDKINRLHKQGAKIILYTSRGMVSCNGDLEKIILKNKDILERWLHKNNVEYDELIFGKPLGDVYVDDKAINVRDFMREDYRVLHGHSGYRVIRLGNMVRKEMSDENFGKLMDWYTISRGIANSPNIISNLYSTLYMTYVEGESGNEWLTLKKLKTAINQVKKFKEVEFSSFDISRVFKKINAHKSDDEEWNELVEECKEYVETIDFSKHASLSHSDYTLGNMIFPKEDELYLVDSLLDTKASSYLLDFAKLKMSLDGYEEMFCGGPHIEKMYGDYLRKKLKKMDILSEVNILEFMYAIRLYNYNDDKELVKEFAKERREEIERGNRLHFGGWGFISRRAH